MSPRPAQLAVLVSGAGTIMEAIITHPVPIALVLADRPCRALRRAAGTGLTTVLVDRATFGYPTKNWDRAGFTAAVTQQLHRHHIDLVAMAGFMTILDPGIFATFAGRILNTHPSLLPAFKGAHAVADALTAGVAETGCTVHLATADLDAGPILAQERVPILPGDTPAILQERIKTLERRLYPRIIHEQLRRINTKPA